MSGRSLLCDLRAFGAECARQAMEGPLYGAGMSLFGLGVGVASLRGGKARLLRQGQREVWKRLESAVKPGERWIWIHAASLGEFEQGRPLIERIRAERPEFRILLTFFSPSGYEVRKNYNGADCVCYLPLDTPGAARRFLRIVNPEMAVFVKYELWRGYLRELYCRQIPSYLISAIFRPEQDFFHRRGAWRRAWLRWLTGIFVQDDRSRRLLESVGVANVTVAGDTRFDRVAGIRREARKIDVLERFVGSKDSSSRRGPVFMAGSSWPADEEVYAPWLAAHKGVKAVVAPHEFDASRLARLKTLFGEGTVLKSEAERDPSLLDGARVMVIDCFGLLSSAYAYADFAYVGGGFGVGIHNINEAAAWGIPVVYGPNYHKFIEAEELNTLGGGLPVAGRAAFEAVADRLAFDSEERGRRGRWAEEYIAEKIGATDRILSRILK